jgi:hypothetical protein
MNRGSFSLATSADFGGFDDQDCLENGPGGFPESRSGMTRSRDIPESRLGFLAKKSLI